MNACVGCHSCEVACAEQNGTPVDEAWRRVGELETGTFPNTRRYNLSMACNHCLDPTCLSGCPTDAYEKLGNGIVVHHPDECVGCQYCMWNCPYEVPVFDKARRIVSKCDMCRPRIDAGQSPACVQSCPTFAIGIEKVEGGLAGRPRRGRGPWPAAGGHHPVDHQDRAAPGDPPEMTAADDHRVEPEDAHWPLLALTLLTQLSLGTVATTVVLQLAGAASRASWEGPRSGRSPPARSPWARRSCTWAGRRRALKALRNVRTSWLSREVALFSVFSGLSLGYAASLDPVVGMLAVVAGVAGVYASGRLYLVPARPVWNSWRTPVAFFATAAATGPLLAFFTLDRSGWPTGGWWPWWRRPPSAPWPRWRCRPTWRRRPAPSDRQHQGTAHLLFERFGGRFQLRLARPPSPSCCCGGPARAAGGRGRGRPAGRQRWSWWRPASCSGGGCST